MATEPEPSDDYEKALFLGGPAFLHGKKLEMPKHARGMTFPASLRDDVKIGDGKLAIYYRTEHFDSEGRVIFVFGCFRPYPKRLV